ncbi:MAG: hypothetical protein ACR5KV_03700 [Wolbachia sp.]
MFAGSSLLLRRIILISEVAASFAVGPALGLVGIALLMQEVDSLYIPIVRS